MDTNGVDSGFSPDQLATLSGSQGVVALTDNGREDILVIERQVAARLAAALGVTLFLADRSQRTWTETPHVHGPAGIEELRALGVDYMVEQLEEAAALGAPEVRALAPSMPNFDALRDVLEASGADIVVTPTELDHLRLFDRLQLHGDLPAQVKEVAGDRHVVAVDRNGAITIL